MRSISRLPCGSNKHNSTFSALVEKMAKFVPRPSQVAPSLCGLPADSRALGLRDEEYCRKRGNDKADLWDWAVIQRFHASAVPHIAAAINRCICVEHLLPDS